MTFKVDRLKFLNRQRGVELADGRCCLVDSGDQLIVANCQLQQILIGLLDLLGQRSAFGTIVPTKHKMPSIFGTVSVILFVADASALVVSVFGHCRTACPTELVNRFAGNVLEAIGDLRLDPSRQRMLFAVEQFVAQRFRTRLCNNIHLGLAIDF